MVVGNHLQPAEAAAAAVDLSQHCAVDTVTANPSLHPVNMSCNPCTLCSYINISVSMQIISQNAAVDEARAGSGLVAYVFGRLTE